MKEIISERFFKEDGKRLLFLDISLAEEIDKRGVPTYRLLYRKGVLAEGRDGRLSKGKPMSSRERADEAYRAAVDLATQDGWTAERPSRGPAPQVQSAPAMLAHGRAVVQAQAF